MYGYNGKVVIIDLEKREYKISRIKETQLRLFIGGASLGALLLTKLSQNYEIDPLFPENPLIFMTGPLTGTIAPTSGRHAVVSKSPLTGILGEATAGGIFGATLKKSGYDGIIIIGKSDVKTYILIDNKEVEIYKADDLWGLGNYDTIKELKKRHGQRASISSIGPAGENLVRYASIMNDNGRVAGRTGLGAVMGSKNLKAIVVLGDKEVEYASEDFVNYSIQLSKELRESVATLTLRELGTASYFEIGYELGDIPGKYFTSLNFDPSALSGMSINEKYKVSPKACYACPIGCGREIAFDDLKIHGPEYETLAALGSLNLIQDLDKVIMANHLCNDLGLDTISTGVSIAFATYLTERGIIPKSLSNLHWCDGGLLLNTIKKIAYRRALGNILAEGVRRLAKKFGVDQRLAAHVKGLEIPMHDPRAFFSMALVYMTGNRGACHLRGDAYTTDLGVLEDANFNLVSTEPHTLSGKASIVIGIQNLREIFNSALLCIFSHFKSSQVAKLISLATGWDLKPKELYIIGERSFNLKRIINNHFGVTREDDRIPEIVIKPYSSGPIEGITPKDSLEPALREYYDRRNWDWNSGKPNIDKLRQLNLETLVSS